MASKRNFWPGTNRGGTRARAALLASIAALACSWPLRAEDAAPGASAATEASKRADTLKYGIESQVLELVSTLAGEKNDDFKDELLAILDGSASPKLRIAVLGFFGKLEDEAAEGRAAAFVKGRDELDAALVDAAFSYLAGIKSGAAAGEAEEILKDGEKRFARGAIIALGSGGDQGSAKLLAEAYGKEGAGEQEKEEILLALGKLKSVDSYDFISGIALSADSSKVLRMRACAALGELGDPRAIKTLVSAQAATDPNVRASAIAALGKFPAAEAKRAVREGLRDSHVLARLAAAKATGESGDGEAIPFLEFKIRNDPERQVREASIEALSKIGGKGAEAFLAELAEDGKAAVAYRASAFKALILRGGPESRGRMLAALEAAKPAKDRAAFMAFAREAAQADAPESAPFVESLLADTDFQVRLGAIAWVERNRHKPLADAVKRLSDSDPVEAVRKRASLALGRLEK